jgi:outer membrane protein
MNGMKRLVSPVLLSTVIAALTVGLGSAFAQSQKVGIINIQQAIAQSTDGQKAARDLQAKFAPKRTELEKMQSELSALQEQLRSQEKTLSDDARNKLMRQIDDKTRALNRSNEDATQEFQAAEQDAINEIGQKMMAIISDYAEKNNLSVVLDVSSPQTPVLYADQPSNITQAIIEQYNKTHAAGAAPTAAPAAAAPSAAPAAPKPAAPAAPAAPKP